MIDWSEQLRSEPKADIRSRLMYCGAFDELDRLRQLRIEEPDSFKQYTESVFRHAAKNNSVAVVRFYIEEVGVSLYDENGDVWSFLTDANKLSRGARTVSSIPSADELRLGVRPDESISEYIKNSAGLQYSSGCWSTTVRERLLFEPSCYSALPALPRVSS